MPISPPLPPLEETQVGQAAFDSLAEARAALVLPDPLPRVNSSYVARQVLELLGLLAGQEARVLALLSQEYGQQVQAALARLRPAAHALRYVAAQYELAGALAANSRLPWHELVVQAQQLRQVGLHWVELLAHLGTIPESVVAAIRANQGYDDLAQDLLALGRLLGEHWDRLAGFQLHETDPARRLTPASSTQLQQVGAQLIEALAAGRPEAEPAINWRAELLRSYELLRQTYETVRHPAILYFQVTGQPDQAARFIAASGMRRPPTRTGKTDAPLPPAPTEPTTPER